jgi:hypothetical protein
MFRAVISGAVIAVGLLSPASRSSTPILLAHGHVGGAKLMVTIPVPSRATRFTWSYKCSTVFTEYEARILPVGGAELDILDRMDRSSQGSIQLNAPSLKYRRPRLLIFRGCPSNWSFYG